MVMVRTGGSRCPYGSFRVGADVFPGKAVVLRSHRIHRCLHHVAYMSSQIADSHTHTHTHFGHTRRSVQPRQSVLLCALPRCVAYDCRYCRQRFPFICPGTFATVSRQWVGAMCDAVNDTIWRPVIASLALHVDVCGLQSFIPCHRVFYTRALTFNFWRRRSLLPFIALQDELTALSLPVDSRQRDG